jgi:glutamyl-tRNA reductase
MNIVIVGLNHDTAGVEIREKVAFDGPKLGDAVERLKKSPDIKEIIILSTCNRVEIYAGVKDTKSGTDYLKNFIAGFHGMPAARGCAP